MRQLIKVLFCVMLFSVQGLFGQGIEVDEINLGDAPSNADKVEALLNFAWVYQSRDIEKALLYGKEGLKIAKELTNQKLVADANHIIGVVNWNKGNYQQASKFFFDALYIREVISDKIGLSKSYDRIGNLYYKQENYSHALKYYSNGLEIWEELKDSIGLIYSYNFLGDIFVKQGLVEKARENYFRGLSIAKVKDHFRGEAFVLYNLGLMYKLELKQDSALVYFNKSMNLSKINNEQIQVSKNLIEIAAIDIVSGDFGNAIPKIEEARRISENLGAKEPLAKSCEQLAIAYAGNGDFEKAYFESLLYTELSNELSNVDIERALKEVQYKYEDASEQLGLSERIRKLSKNTVVFLIFGLIMGVVAGLSLLYRYKNQQKSNKELKQKNEYINEQNEALLRSNSALEQFAYVASHDLKEPLRNINTYSFLLSENLEGEAKKVAKKYLKLISEGSSYMNDLLQGILSYSSLTQSNHSLDETVDLKSTLMTVKETLRNVIIDKKVVFEVDELPSIKSNKIQMFQLFQNLISNGIKFNDKENPIVQIKYSKELDGHLLEFKDNGIGFNEKYKEKVFQIFQRLEGKKYTGTGVGMAICKRIITQHGGEISVSSTIGKGTSFFVRIPFTSPEENHLIL